MLLCMWLYKYFFKTLLSILVGVYMEVVLLDRLVIVLNFLRNHHTVFLEKEMATHSSVLVWRILGTGEPGGLPSMGLHRVGHG